MQQQINIIETGRTVVKVTAEETIETVKFSSEERIKVNVVDTTALVIEHDFSTVSVVATENISAFLPVVSTGAVADASILAHRLKFIGLALTNINNGFSGNVQPSGEIENNSWSWAPGSKIYIGVKVLTTTPPTIAESVFSQCIGLATSATKILLNAEQSFLL